MAVLFSDGVRNKTEHDDRHSKDAEKERHSNGRRRPEYQHASGHHRAVHYAKLFVESDVARANETEHEHKLAASRQQIVLGSTVRPDAQE